MSLYSERQPTWVINPAAANNRDTGLDAAHALRDSAELTRRRWGRGSVVLNQPTTIRYMGAVPAGDALCFDNIVIGPAGNLVVECDRTVAATGALTAVTDFASGTQAQEVVATGLGSHVGKQIEITASATPAHVGAQAEIAVDLGSGRVRTQPFAIPRVDGTIPSFAQTAPSIVRPDIGDTFTVYDRPAMPVGLINLLPGSRANAQNGGGFGYALFKNFYMQGESTYSASLESALTYPIFNGCRLERLIIRMSSVRLQSCQVDTCFFERGSSAHKFTLFRDTFPSKTQFIRSHYGDLHYALSQGSYLPFTYGGSTLIGYDWAAFDSADQGLHVNPSGYVLAEGPVWGSGNGQYGVLIWAGAKFYAFSSNTRTLTGSLGDLGIRQLAGGTEQVHTWAEGTFITAEGSGLVLRP
jgi:hypothetical protein